MMAPDFCKLADSFDGRAVSRTSEDAALAVRMSSIHYIHRVKAFPLWHVPPRGIGV